MRLRISERPALHAAALAAGFRVFCGLMLERAQLHNGAQLSAIIGAMLALPMIAGFRRIAVRLERLNRSAAAPLALALLAANLADGASVVRTIVRSASFLSLDRASMATLLIPIGLALYWCMTRNGDAVGDSAAMGIRVFALLLGVILLLQLRCYRAAWLTPLLGSGWPSVIEGGVRAAGWMVSIFGIMIVAGCEGDEPAGTRPARWLIAAAGTAAAMISLQLMMAPTLEGRDANWLNRLGALLTNGRAEPYNQFPMIVLWYAGLMHLLTCEGFTAALLVQRLAPALDGRACVAMVIAFALAASRMINFGSALVRGISQWLYVAVAVVTAAALCATGVKGGGNR